MITLCESNSWVHLFLCGVRTHWLQHSHLSKRDFGSFGYFWQDELPPTPQKKINNLALDSHSPHGPCHSPVSLSADVMWAGTGAIGLKLFWRQRALPPALTLNSLSTPQWEQPVQNTPSSQDMARPPPPSLCTCGSCSFIANWTFHSEKNNYSQEKRGLPWNADMTCNVTLPLKIEEVNTLPSQSPARNTEWKREREGEYVCLWVWHMYWYWWQWIHKGHSSIPMRDQMGVKRQGRGHLLSAGSAGAEEGASLQVLVFSTPPGWEVMLQLPAS